MIDPLRIVGSATAPVVPSVSTSGASDSTPLEEARALVAAGHAAKVWVVRNRGRWLYHCWIGTVHFHSGALPVPDHATVETAVARARTLLPEDRVAILPVERLSLATPIRVR